MAIWTYSGNVYSSSPQGTTVFPLTSMQGNSIEYLQRSHIHVYSSVNQGTDYVELSTPADWGFNAEGTEIVLTSGIATGTWIKLQRITPYLDEYVQFQASSQLTAGQLNTGELFSMYVDQELFDQFALLNSFAIKYLGAIDLTVDASPVTPEGGDFYINTGAGIVVASWTGIAGDSIVGSEQVVYNATTSEWEIYAVPSSQVGVVEVKGTAPIDVDATDNQRPVVSITDATQSSKGSLSAADKTKLDNYPVAPPNGTAIGPTPPSNPAATDQWWDSDEGRGYVYYEDADSSQWVEMNPSWNGSVADGVVTPPKLSTGGPSWNTSGDLTISGGSIVLYANGNATFSGNITAANVSDIRFKENIADAKPQLADVVALGSSLKNWDWKKEAPLNNKLKAKRFLGIIAQEAEIICPGLTYEVKSEDSNESYKAINHDILVMKLLGAVAEQNARIEALEAKAQSLEKGIN